MTIIDYLEKNVDYLEHSSSDPTGFWPHHCEECCHFDGTDCALDCIQYRDLNLAAYIGLRMKEKDQ